MGEGEEEVEGAGGEGEGEEEVEGAGGEGEGEGEGAGDGEGLSVGRGEWGVKGGVPWSPRCPQFQREKWYERYQCSILLHC